MAERPTSWAEVIRRAIDAKLADIHTTIPGKVVRVNMSGANVRSVDVQPVIKRGYLDEEDRRVVEDMPVIPSVPVEFPSAGDYRITFPIAVGTTGLIHFSEASLDVWLAKGGTVDPQDDRRFNLSDAIFSPGLRAIAEPHGSTPTDRMTIGDDGGLQIHIDKSSIRLGDNAAIQAIVKGTQHFTSFKTFLDGVITFAGIGASLSGLPTADPTFFATFPAASGLITGLGAAITALGPIATAMKASLDPSLSDKIKTI